MQNAPPCKSGLNVLISVHQWWWWLSLKFHDKWQLTFISFSDSASIFHAYLSLCLVICISNTLFFISSNYFLQIWTNLLIILSKCLRKLMKLQHFWLSPPKFRHPTMPKFRLSQAFLSKFGQISSTPPKFRQLCWCSDNTT